MVAAKTEKKIRRSCFLNLRDSIFRCIEKRVWQNKYNQQWYFKLLIHGVLLIEAPAVSCKSILLTWDASSGKYGGDYPAGNSTDPTHTTLKNWY
jgi:hypothetical protein